MTPTQRYLSLSLCFLITFVGGQFNECPETDSQCLTISRNRTCSSGFMSACSLPLTSDCDLPCIATSITSQFVYVDEFVNFNHAIQGCQDMERQLVSVHNQQQADDVAALCDHHSNHFCWIGLHRNVDEVDFKWIDGSNSTDYEFPWFVHDPDVPLGLSACVLVDGRSATWIDENCGNQTDLRAPYICGPIAQRSTSMPQQTLSTLQTTDTTDDPTLESTIGSWNDSTLSQTSDQTMNPLYNTTIIETTDPRDDRNTREPKLSLTVYPMHNTMITNSPTTEPTFNPTTNEAASRSTSELTGILKANQTDDAMTGEPISDSTSDSSTISTAIATRNILILFVILCMFIAPIIIGCCIRVFRKKRTINHSYDDIEESTKARSSIDYDEDLDGNVMETTGLNQSYPETQV